MSKTRSMLNNTVSKLKNNESESNLHKVKLTFKEEANNLEDSGVEEGFVYVADNRLTRDDIYEYVNKLMNLKANDKVDLKIINKKKCAKWLKGIYTASECLDRIVFTGRGFTDMYKLIGNFLVGNISVKILSKEEVDKLSGKDDELFISTIDDRLTANEVYDFIQEIIGADDGTILEIKIINSALSKDLFEGEFTIYKYIDNTVLAGKKNNILLSRFIEYLMNGYIKARIVENDVSK